MEFGVKTDHDGEQSGDGDLCGSVAEEKPKKSVEGHHQETENRHSHHLRQIMVDIYIHMVN